MGKEYSLPLEQQLTKLIIKLLNFKIMKSKIKKFQVKKEVKVLTIQQKSKVNGRGGTYRTAAITDGD